MPFSLHSSKRKAILIPVLVALVFLAPLLGSFFIFEWRPAWLEKTTNQGRLILPPIDFTKLSLYDDQGKPIKGLGQNHWMMLWVSFLPCDKMCEANLIKMRQIYRGFLQAKRERILRAWLTFKPITDPKLLKQLHTDYAGTAHVVANETELTRLMHKSASSKPLMPKDRLYIVDPHGNMVLSYAPDATPKGLRKDLLKLLKVSKIG